MCGYIVPVLNPAAPATSTSAASTSTASPPAFLNPAAHAPRRTAVRKRKRKPGGKTTSRIWDADDHE